jgi:hypothetical protein
MTLLGHKQRRNPHTLTSRDLENGTGVCQICGPTILWGLKGQAYCPNRKREARWLHVYGMTPDELNELLRNQKGRCAICRIKLSKDFFTRSAVGRATAVHVDHDHLTDMARGILCHHCNLGIGNFRDSVKLLKAAVAYLEGYG